MSITVLFEIAYPEPIALSRVVFYTVTALDWKMWPEERLPFSNIATLLSGQELSSAGCFRGTCTPKTYCRYRWLHYHSIFFSGLLNHCNYSTWVITYIIKLHITFSCLCNTTQNATTLQTHCIQFNKWVLRQLLRFQVEECPAYGLALLKL